MMLRWGRRNPVTSIFLINLLEQIWWLKICPRYNQWPCPLTIISFDLKWSDANNTQYNSCKEILTSSLSSIQDIHSCALLYISNNYCNVIYVNLPLHHFFQFILCTVLSSITTRRIDYSNKPLWPSNRFELDCVSDRLLFSLRRDTTQNTNKTYQKHKMSNQQLLNWYTYLFN